MGGHFDSDLFFLATQAKPARACVQAAQYLKHMHVPCISDHTFKLTTLSHLRPRPHCSVSKFDHEFVCHTANLPSIADARGNRASGNGAHGNGANGNGARGNSARGNRAWVMKRAATVSSSSRPCAVQRAGLRLTTAPTKLAVTELAVTERAATERAATGRAATERAAFERVVT